MSTPEAIVLAEAPEHRPQEYVADVSFADLGLPTELVTALSRAGIASPYSPLSRMSRTGAFC